MNELGNKIEQKLNLNNFKSMFNPMLNSRRDILWNIKQPGDPYDITKSMIRKLPGEERIFMGDNLELVCLFQAAEIERLTLYLNEYMLKYRQIQRQSLDRHSYEEIIKELTEKWNMADSDRKEKTETLSKLRDFVQKQSRELEELKKYSKDQVQAKYQEALKQLEEYSRANGQLKDENGSLLREVQQLRSRVSQLEYQLEKSGPQVSTVEIQQLKYRYETEIRSLDIQCKRFQEENFGLRTRLEQLERVLAEYRGKDSARSQQGDRVQRLEGENVRLQNSIALLRQENERLVLMERERSGEVLGLRDQLRLREEQTVRYRSESSQLALRLQAQEGRIRELEANLRGSRYQQSSEQEQLVEANKKMERALTELSIEIERLNNVLKVKVGNLEQAQKRLRDCQYELSKTEILRRENQTNRVRLQEQARRLSDYENKIALLSQQIQRLNMELRRRMGEGNSGEERYKIMVRENQEYRARIAMMTNKMEQDVRSYEDAIQRTRRQYEEHRMRADTYARKLSEYENKMAVMSQEIQRLNVVLDRTVKQRDSMGQRDVSTIKATYESRIMNLTAENQEMRRKLAEYIQQLRRVEDYEKKLTALSQEVRRLNDVLAVKLDEINKLSDLIRQRENENAQLRSQLGQESGQSVVVLQQKETEIITLRRQLESITGQLRQAQDEINNNRQVMREMQKSGQQTFELQQKLVSLSQEIQRLNEVLGKMKQQNDQLKSQSRAIPEYETRISMFESKTTTYQRQIETISSQLQQSESIRRQLQSRLGQQSGDLQRKLYEQEQKISGLSLELEHKNRYIQEYEQKVNESNIKIRQSDKNLAEYTSKMVMMSKEIDRLNEVIQRISQDTDQQKGRLQQYVSYEQQVERDMQEYQRKLSDYEAKIALFGQQIQRLNLNLQDKVRQLNGVQSQLNNTQRELDETRYRLQVCEGSRGNDEQRFRRAQQQVERLTKVVREKQIRITQITTTIESYHEKLVVLSRENERLGGGVQENEQAKRKLAEDQARLQQVHQQLVGQHNNVLNRLTEYENKIGLLSQEVTRLNQVMRSMSSQKQQLVVRLQRLGENEQSLSRDNQDMNTRIVQYENRIAIASQQIARLQELIKSLKQQKEQAIRTVHQLQEELSRVGPRLPEYENKMTQMVTEIQRLNGLLGNFKKENQDLKRELTLSNQRYNDARGVIAQLQSKLNLASQERERCQGMLRRSETQKGQLSSKLQLLTREGDKWNEETAGLRRKLVEYEEQMRRMSQQIERLGGLLQRTGSQSQQLTIKIQSFQRVEQQLRVTIESNERQILEYQNKIALLSQQLERLNLKYSDEYGQVTSKIQEYTRREQQLQQQMGAMQRKLSEWENKAAVMGQQIARLNDTLQAKVRQINSLKAQIVTLTKDSQESKYKLRASEEAYRQIQVGYREATTQIQRLNRLVGDNSSALAQFQDRSRQYIEEIERLNNTLRIKVEETRRWEQRCVQLESMVQSESGQWRAKYEETQRQFNAERQQHKTLQQAYQRLLAEYEKSKNSLREYELMIQKLNQEFNRLQEIIRGQKLKCEQFDTYKQRVTQYESELQLQIKVLQQQVLRLRSVISQSEEHIRNLTDHRCQQADLQKRVQEHLSLFVVLFAEIESLRNRLISKQVEVENVRRSSLAPFMQR